MSGGHFNPAVTFAMFLDKRIDVKDMVGYWVFQLVGAVLASLAFGIILSRDAVASTYTVLAKPTVGTFGGVLAEAVLTLIFVTAVLVLSKSQAHSKYLGMGFTLTAVHLIGIVFTGSSVNPARSFAPALVGGTWTDFWVYLVGPLVGAALAWVVYKFVVLGDTDLTDDLDFS
ncbi:aquaporin [bacterium]|nr:aquaporin [bacterium]